MAKLTAGKRSALPKASFGMPGARKYPMPDKSHARNALARASQQAASGNLSAGERSRIAAKAHRILKSGRK